MDISDFMVEEYRQLYCEIKNYQDHYTRIERSSLVGAGAAYGFLILNQDKLHTYLIW